MCYRLSKDNDSVMATKERICNKRESTLMSRNSDYFHDITATRIKIALTKDFKLQK